MNDNTRIWQQVCTTDPAHTKPVKLGAREYTSIDAMYQIQRATEVFGPVGAGWSYTAEYSVEDANGYALAVADVRIHWFDRVNNRTANYGPVRAVNVLVTPVLPIEEALLDRAEDAMTKSDGSLNTAGLANALTNIRKASTPRLDEDAFKKALTDALTKALSHLGFSADVFLGQFDDPDYVAQQEAANNPTHKVAAQYLAPMREYIINNDSLGGLQIIQELRGMDESYWITLWGMLGKTERDTVKAWKPAEGEKGA